MATQYVVQFGQRDSRDQWARPEVLDETEVPMRLGEHELLEIVMDTGRGHRRVLVTAKVQQYRLGHWV